MIARSLAAAFVTIAVLTCCTSIQPSHATVIRASDTQSYTPETVSALSAAERARFVDATTTSLTGSPIPVFVPSSPTGQNMDTGGCQDGPGVVSVSETGGGMFTVPPHVHVFVVGPIGQAMYYTIATDDGLVGLVCKDAISGG